MAQHIAFEWQTGEEEYLQEFARTGGSLAHELLGDGERRLSLIALRSVALFMILIAASGSASLSVQQIDRMRTANALNIVLEMDEAAWRERDREGYDLLIDPSVNRIWAAEWRDNWGASRETGRAYELTLGATRRLSPQLVQAEVYAALPRTNWWQAAETRETRYYRESGGLWLRTLPPDEFWGEPLTLRSTYFTFNYFPPDSESVRDAAPRLDAAYSDLYEALGLPSLSADDPITVAVKPGFVRSRGWEAGILELTSPLLTPIPSGMSNADYLADRVFRRVSSVAIRDSTSYQANRRWAFVFSVLRSWLSTELLDQSSAWRAESEQIFAAHTPQMLPLELADIDEYYVGGEPGRATVLWRFAAANSVFDYLVAEEGHGVVQKLMGGFSHSGSWAGLLEAVAGISEEDFTKGWNEYLAAKYGF